MGAYTLLIAISKEAAVEFYEMKTKIAEAWNNCRLVDAVVFPKEVMEYFGIKDPYEDYHDKIMKKEREIFKAINEDGHILTKRGKMVFYNIDGNTYCLDI